MKFIKYTLLIVILALALAPAKTKAITLSYTAFIGANGGTCATPGYISPSTDTRNQGDVLTITFKNEQLVDLQIRNFPGGNISVPGNGQATRTATMESTITYQAWLADGSCQKSSATITVNPTPAAAAPAPSSSSNTPSAPAASAQQQADPSIPPTDEEHDVTQTPEPKKPAEKAPNAKDPLLIILIVIELGLIGVLAYKIWHRKTGQAAKATTPTKRSVTKTARKKSNKQTK